MLFIYPSTERPARSIHQIANAFPVQKPVGAAGKKNSVKVVHICNVSRMQPASKSSSDFVFCQTGFMLVFAFRAEESLAMAPNDVTEMNRGLYA
jgi:hypothetical protein